MVLSRKKKSRKDGGVKGQAVNGTLLRRALSWAFADDVGGALKLHGNTGWTVNQLVVLAVLWVWSDQKTLTGAFAEARELALGIYQTVAVTSFQGLTKALVGWTGQMLPILWTHLHGLMEQIGGRHWRIGGWLPIAVDGSRVTTPRTASNERAFGARHYGKSKSAKSRRRWKNKRRRSKPLSQPVAPQIWLTLLWHVGLKMPWAWKTGPSTSSERHHFLELLQSQSFPEKTLFCADAGFVGYEFWQGIISAGHRFVIRVGANVHLLRHLGRVRVGAGIVYLWPKTVADKKQPPLMLRLLEFQGPRSPICLVTNVLSANGLTDNQARTLYRLRWGVELQFRALKQTFGRGQLRSRTADNAIVELQWSLLGLWVIQLFAVKEQITIDSPPAQSSVAMAVSIIQELMRRWCMPARSNQELARRLRQAVKDNYRRTRTKAARYRPPAKDKPNAQRPIIVLATKKQRANYEMLLKTAA